MAVEIFGLRQFTTNLKRLGAEAADLQAVFRQIAAEVAQDAQQFAPVGTRSWGGKEPHTAGQLRTKIRGSRYAQNRARITVTGTRHHRFVHFGSSRGWTPPNQFMFKAMDANVDSIDQRVLKGLTDLIERTF